MTKRNSAAPVAKRYVVTNDVPGRTLHLGDGRKLAHGESAEVAKEVFDIIERAGG